MEIFRQEIKFLDHITNYGFWIWYICFEGSGLQGDK